MTYEQMCLATKRGRRSHRPRYESANRKNTKKNQQQQQKFRGRTRRGGRGRRRKVEEEQPQVDGVPGLVFLQDYDQKPVAVLPSGQMVEVLPTTHNLAGAALYKLRTQVSVVFEDEESSCSGHVFGQRALEEAVAHCLEKDDDDDTASVTSSHAVSDLYTDDESLFTDDDLSLPCSDHLFDFLLDDDDDDDDFSIASSSDISIE